MTYKAAATWHQVVDQGKTWSRTLTYINGGIPFDNTSFGARMMVRRNYDSGPVISLTSDVNGGITLGGTNGKITFFVSAVTMEGLSGKYVFDLELFEPLNDEIVYGVVRGTVEVRREVTYV